MQSKTRLVYSSSRNYLEIVSLFLTALRIAYRYNLFTMYNVNYYTKYKHHIHTYIQTHICMRGLSGKIPAMFNKMRTVCVTSMQRGSQGEWTGMRMCEQ